MSKLEKNCIAMVVRVDPQLNLKYGEVVNCVDSMPNKSEITSGRFGYQQASGEGYWWVMNSHGSWIYHEAGLIRLYDGDANDEMLKVAGKPPTLGTTV